MCLFLSSIRKDLEPFSGWNIGMEQAVGDQRPVHNSCHQKCPPIKSICSKIFSPPLFSAQPWSLPLASFTAFTLSQLTPRHIFIFTQFCFFSPAVGQTVATASCWSLHYWSCHSGQRPRPREHRWGGGGGGRMVHLCVKTHDSTREILMCCTVVPVSSISRAFL